MPSNSTCIVLVLQLSAQNRAERTPNADSEEGEVSSQPCVPWMWMWMWERRLVQVHEVSEQVCLCVSVCVWRVG